MNDILTNILQKLDNVKQSGNRWQARCPAHEDHRNSLSVSTGTDGRVLLCCHASCPIDSILAALHLTASDLFLPNAQPSTLGVIAATYDYIDEDGTLLYQVVRYESKDFRQRRPDGHGGWLWNMKGVRRVLYRLPQVIKAVQNGETIYIVEGEKDADNLCKRGLIATCNVGGAGKWYKDSGEAVRGARVVVLRDNDDPGLDHQEKVSRALQGVAATVQALELPGLPEKGDVSDWLAAGGTKEELLQLAENAPASTPEATDTARTKQTNKRKRSSADGDEDEEEHLTTAQQIVMLGKAQTERFHSTETDEPFVRFLVTRQVEGQTTSHRETWPVSSKAFKQWLSRRFYMDTERVPGGQAMDDALRVLEGDCRFDGAAYPLSIRLAPDPSTPNVVWIDLADTDWRAVKVTPEGWQVVDEPPILFRRFALAAPQLLPETGGSLETLRDFLNVRDEHAWVQLVCWLVAALLPDIPHPVLVVHGEQGSAKSTLMQLLSKLLDPLKTPLRVEPRDIGEWVQAAHHSWLVTLDNVSHLPNWLSDAICRAVTGEGFSKRQLYTDNEDIILTFRRVVALTGIEVVAQRADLLDRSILLALTPLTQEQRRSESDVLAAFTQARPGILGALLDILAGVLHELPSVHLERMPRMADFARVGVAVERVIGWPEGTFLKAYNANVETQHEEALDASLVGGAVRAFMQDAKEWTGTATELLAALADEKTDKKQRDWPKNGRGMSGHLKRLAPNLRAIGISVIQEREGGTGARLITLLKTAQQEKQSITASQSSQPSRLSQHAVTQTGLPVTQSIPDNFLPSQPCASHNDGCDDCDDNFPHASIFDAEEATKTEEVKMPIRPNPNNLDAFTH